MEDAESSLALASQLKDRGQVKDAYIAYLDTAQRSLQSLYEVKFIQTSIINKPKQYASLLSALRICLSHIESIIETHSPASPIPLNPLQAQSTGGSQKSKPPVPPKPTRIQKPTIPPKPAIAVSSRPTSPTLVEENNGDKHTPRDTSTKPPRPQPPASKRFSVPSPVDIRLTESSHHRQLSQSVIEVPSSPLQSIFERCEVDPSHLVPAQLDKDLNAGLPTESHVPHIPVPPLLTTYRILEPKLKEAEQQLKEYNAQKRQSVAMGAANKRTSSLGMIPDDELNGCIFHYSGMVADMRLTLNKVRTLYMSAATIPTYLKFEAHLVAYQITLVEAAIFNAIPVKALLEHSHKKPHPCIVASTDFFNYMTRTIEHSILLPQEASARAQHIHYWVKVATRCYDLNNYQTLKTIISALGTPPVQRLRRTWAYIPKKSQLKLDTFNTLMSEEGNYERYREHMGMVSTTVINGKSVALIRSEHFSKPTVPFLGTFILDITYLLAAFNSTPQAKTMSPEVEPRIHDVLQTMRRFQTGPKYPASPSTLYMKQNQRHHLRPALSSMLQRSASGIARLSFGFGSNSSNASTTTGGSSMSRTNNGGDSPSVSSASASLGDMEPKDEDEENIEEQQQMVTQYILMRPWVDQTTIDQLSFVREPPQQKSISQQPRARSSGGGSGNHTSSIVSNTSSMMRLSSGSLSFNAPEFLGDGDSRPTSLEDEDEDKSRFSTGSGFWPFRRSFDSQPSASAPSMDDGASVIDDMLSPTSRAPAIPPRPKRDTAGAN